VAALRKRGYFSRNYQAQEGAGAGGMRAILFSVKHCGEEFAAIRPYTEQVTILIDSGDPGGAPGEFEDHMQSSLSQWYDGATVTRKK
jgi:hypothetical protein